MPDLDLRSLPSLAWRALVFELRLYRSLLRWVARRPAVPKGEVELFGYSRDHTPILLLWIFASAVEIPIAHLLIPWETVRLVVLGLGVWGLLWMLGLLASFRVHPHVVTPTTLHLRAGAGVDIAVPWELVESVRPTRRALPASLRSLHPLETDRGIDLQVSASDHANVQAVLRQPLTVPTSQGQLEVTALTFLVDDPKPFLARARQALEQAQQVST